ncbi:beta-lactamase family protein [Nonomuraea glycinis]|uniref:Serine hydrolase n=1 Tax=Nonomuraea glycinis TaxID=2047744 RepID=A0A918A256_9ACTN|nr:serine hydrolase domain-containing protein [Nonomuraea glycinis]MCA2176954.1 beta-lactamase family protein [Nonomuraea glycinis]GGP02975.1 serine hydrolase [Nonomuraea glycinis]
MVPADIDARLTRLLEKLGARRGLHHVNLALAGGEQHWSGAVGLPGPDTPFFIASITKRFIIALVLQAHERGELALDAPITTYLPAETTDRLHVLGGVDRTAEITVRHLAGHTSGLPDFFEHRGEGPSLFDHLAAGEDVSWTFTDAMRMARRQGPHFAPQDLTARRQKARYSDTGFQLLIRILETVTGRPFAGLLADRVTGPLGLTSTRLPERPVPLYAGRRRVDLPGLIASANDLISTTGDLLTFQQALLKGELFKDPRTVGLLTERRNRLRNVPVLQYGLGTMIFTIGRLAAPSHSSATLVGHSGVTGTWLFHCPELDVHLAGTVDQIKGRAIPFRIMARCLNIWRA